MNKLRNFERITTGLPVQPLLDELEANPELWGEITLRQKYPGTKHKDTENIFLRGATANTYQDFFLTKTSVDYPAQVKLAHVVNPILDPVKEILQVTELGRVIIVKLNPGGHVDIHLDEGIYSDYFSRFHVVLSAEKGSILTVDDEVRHFAPGEAWWFNHKVLHTADNHATTPRIHIIMDAVSPFFPMPPWGGHRQFDYP